MHKSKRRRDGVNESTLVVILTCLGLPCSDCLTTAVPLFQDYLKLSPVHRHRATIIQIKQNEEPAGFTTLFPEWDEDYWQVQKSNH